MQFKLAHQEQESILSLRGELSLIHAGQFKDELIRALDSAQRVVIETEALSAIDLACLQLICSAHQSALVRGKELILNPRQSEAFMQQIEQSGFTRRYHCDSSGTTGCLWHAGD